MVIIISHHHCYPSVSICFIFAIIYVLGLYVLSPSTYRYDRNHPHVIRRRIFSVFIVCSLIYIFLYKTSNTKTNINEWLGFRKLKTISSIWTLILYPIILTLMLYFGPLVQWIDIFHWKYYRKYWKNYLPYFDGNDRHIFIRNYLVAPFTEEFVFRSSILCLLYPHISTFSAIFISPLFFGLAHFHHMVEHFNRNHQENHNRLTALNIIFIHLFQFSYTYVFGVYSSFLFIQTGHFLPSFLVHTLCNGLGLPDIGSLIHMQGVWLKKCFFYTCYLVGVWLFYTSLFSLTQSKLFYSNNNNNVIYRNWSI